MTAEQRERVRELFGAAVELPPAEGDALVAGADADFIVREEVRQLLQHHRASGSFMTTRQLTGAEPASNVVARRIFRRGEIIANRYRIERFLNAGGMGEVYEVYDARLEERIALKTIVPSFAGDRRATRRFKREITLARRVTHPNICRVYDWGDHRDAESGDLVAFLTMELLSGETLAGRLEREGRFKPAEALPLIHQMAEALTAAHNAGVIHRDFKPGNVLLVPEGNGRERVVVSDFGLARTVEPETGGRSLSAAGQVFGTPDYMAPEQLTGGEVGPPADVYALGLVIYEMVTGRRPFPGGEALENAVLRVTSPPPRVREHIPELDERWTGTIERCLEKEPAARPRSPLEVLAGLEGDEDALEPAGQRSVPAGKSATTLRWWSIVAAIFILLALAAGISRFLESQGTGGAAGGESRQVVVLPFKVDSEEFRVFADGLMQAIASRLSHYDGMNGSFQVVPGSEVLRQKAVTVSEAMKLLGANVVVEGNLQHQEDRLRLLLTVVDANAKDGGRSPRTAIVEGTRAKALTLQDDAVAGLANILDLRAGTEHVAELNRLIPIQPGAHEFYLQGIGYLQREDRLEDVENAITVFRRAIEADENHAQAYGGLARAQWAEYRLTSRPELPKKAERNARNALRLDPRLPEARIALGTVLAGTGRDEEALRQFEQALTMDARNAVALQGLAEIHVRQGRPKLAESVYRKVIELRPGDWTGYKQLGLFYADQAEYEKAAEQFELVTRLVPDNAQGYLNLGAMRYYEGRWDEARRTWEKALAIDPQRTSLHNNLATLLFKQGEFGQAAERYHQAAEHAPDDYLIRGNLAACYFWLKDPRAGETFREAIRLAKRDLDVNPKKEEIYSQLALYYASIGEDEPAREWVRKAGRRDVKNKAECLRIANVYEELGERGAAIKWVQRAVERGASRQEAEQLPGLRGVLSDERLKL